MRCSWPHLDAKTEGFETLDQRRVICLGPAFLYAPPPPRGRLPAGAARSGVTLFHEMTRQINLKLLEYRPFKNGCVLVKYRVERLAGALPSTAPLA